ncbi:MAG: hypothetical protein ACRDOK_02600 [Streptosporangiaceae bacterium]
MPFRFEEETTAGGPVTRENVDAGMDVIDITKLRDDLEAGRRRRRDGGD